MILVKPSVKILSISHEQPLLAIEAAGRRCYKSEEKTSDDGVAFCRARAKQGHWPIFEFVDVTVEVVCDRGVSHEIVRHRLCSYAQESTRYCNYGGGVTFVIPPWIDVEPGEYRNPHRRGIAGTDLVPADRSTSLLIDSLLYAEAFYLELLTEGWTAQQARGVLPNCLKTELTWNANLVEWRHIFKLRTSKAAHPQMREIMIPLLAEFKARIPVVFEDLGVPDL